MTVANDSASRESVSEVVNGAQMPRPDVALQLYFKQRFRDGFRRWARFLRNRKTSHVVDVLMMVAEFVIVWWLFHAVLPVPL